MNIAQFITELESKNIQLSIKDKNLLLKSPKGILIGGYVDVIRQNKPAIIEHLKNQGLHPKSVQDCTIAVDKMMDETKRCYYCGNATKSEGYYSGKYKERKEIDKNEASKFLGVSTRMVERYEKEGRLSARTIRVGRTRKNIYDEGELSELKAELNAVRVRPKIEQNDTSRNESMIKDLFDVTAVEQNALPFSDELPARKQQPSLIDGIMEIDFDKWNAIIDNL